MSTFRTAVSVVTCIVFAFTTLPVFAQSDGESGGDGDESGTSTVILNFKKREVPDDVMEAFYSALDEGINSFEGTRVVSGGDMTIDDLIVTVGCDSPNPECLSGLNSYVDADRMVFGSVQRSEDVYLFTIKMFDFAEERFVHKVSEQTVEGDAETVKEAIPAVIDSLLYGDDGKVRVDISGADDADVFFDGQKMGPAPTTLENLPLGQHAVTVKTSDDEKTKFVLLEKGKEATASFDFGGKTEAPVAKPSGSKAGGPPIAAIAAGGAGVVGLIVGVAGQLQAANNSEKAASIVCGSGDQKQLCDSGNEFENREALVARANELDQKIQTGNALMIAGYSAGLVGLGVGGFMLLNHSGGGAESGGASAAKALRISPRRGGVEVGLSWDF